jgi:hypothetical protein
MAVTHTWQLSVKPSGLPTLPADTVTTITGDWSIDIDDSILAGQTKQVFDGSIDTAKMVSWVMHASVASNTVNTNSSNGAGGQSFALGAAKSTGWNSTMQFSNTITTDITGIWVVNGGTTDSVFRGSFLMTMS